MKNRKDLSSLGKVWRDIWVFCGSILVFCVALIIIGLIWGTNDKPSNDQHKQYIKPLPKKYIPPVKKTLEGRAGSLCKRKFENSSRYGAKTSMWDSALVKTIENDGGYRVMVTGEVKNKYGTWEEMRGYCEVNKYPIESDWGEDDPANVVVFKYMSHNNIDN